MTSISSTHRVQLMQEELNEFNLDFDNVVIHSRLRFFKKEITDSGLSIKLGHQGTEHYWINGQHRAVSRGNYLLVNRHSSFRCMLNTPEPVEAFCLYLSKSTVQKVAYGLQHSERELLDAPTVRRDSEPAFFENIYRTDQDQLGHFLERHRNMLIQGQLPEDGSFFYTLAEQLLLSQNQIHHQINRIAASQASTREELYRRLCIARDYIHDNFRREITLDGIARKALLSKYHLLRSYKQTFSITPYQLVLQLRLQASAKMIIQQQQTSLEEIATNTGFSDRRSFTKAFKKAYGCPPSKFNT